MNLDHSNFTVNLLKRGKKPIKSSITAWNRSRKKEKKLPKYTTGLKRRSMLHFPLTGVSKTSVDVDGEEYFVNSEDTHVVFTQGRGRTLCDAWHIFCVWIIQQKVTSHPVKKRAERQN